MKLKAQAKMQRLRSRIPRVAILLLIIALMFFTGAIPVIAKPPVTSTIDLQAPLQSDLMIDAGELRTFVNNEINSELDASGVPGAAVVIVKDNAIILEEGFGFADIEGRKPIVVNQTVFRAASVTKLFTWTAVMQQVERGRLDLNADVNTYLATFQIPKTYPQPITMANLMAHNAGFESDEALGWVPEAARLLPLGDYVARFMPSRVRPPGEVSVYSNYGASLAGYVVEQVSGVSFDEYVRTNILEPLGMTHTTLQQPPPSSLSAELSRSYLFPNGVATSVSLGNYMGSPAGVMLSTAADMAPFMIAHLQNGVHDNNRILKAATVQQMHEQLFTTDPRVPGIAHGFQEYFVNGQRVIGHFGALDAFYSSLMFIPDQGFGWFVVFNGENSAASPGSFLIALMNHLFPSEPYVKPEPPSDFSTRAAQYTGFYRNARIEHSSYYKLVSLSAEFEVTGTPRGSLLVRGAEFVEAKPDLFKPYSSNNSWNESLLFIRDSTGQAYLSGISGVYERVPWFETAAFSWSLVLTCSVLFLSVLVTQGIKAIIRHKSKQKTPSSKWAKGLSWLTVAICVLFISSVVGIRFAAGNSIVWSLVVAVGVAGSTVTFASVPLVVLSWTRRYWSLPERVHWTLMALAALAFIWFLNNWNLLFFPPA